MFMHNLQTLSTDLCMQIYHIRGRSFPQE